MVQALNAKAIFTLASVLRRPSLVIPHVAVETVSEVDYEALQSTAGITAVVFDKDNTLTAPYAQEIHPKASSGLEQALKVFGKDRVAILSNSAGTYQDDPGFCDAKQIEQSLGVRVIRHKEKKPGGMNEVLQHFDMQDSTRICVVGDRVLTDIVFGNLYGLLTVHTKPLCVGKDNDQDNWTAKLLRPLENRLLYGRMGKLVLPKSSLEHKHWPGPKECPLVRTQSQAK